MATICPRCEAAIRDGSVVRVSLLAEYSRQGLDAHGLSVIQEEWVEHKECQARDWEEKLVLWTKRTWRKITECI